MFTCAYPSRGPGVGSRRLAHDTAIPLARQCPVKTAGEPLRAASSRSSGETVRSLYIHVPFCFHKCHYCDFYSLVDTRDRQAAYTDRLTRELTALSPWAVGGPLRTVFVGGGTPSLLRVDLWRRVLSVLREQFDLSEMGQAGPGEFTVECNPETVSPELMDVLAGGGVNRVSIGAQSFDPRHLRTLERRHEPANVARAVEAARVAGIPRQSVDLIFGIPGQTLAEWERDLSCALALGTGHVSCYNLTYEPNTAMTARLARGEFTPADEDLEIEMHAATLRLARAAGLERYEVSNHAAPGQESLHNLAYWRQDPWLSAGPSASAHVGGHRWKNVPRLDDYLLGGDAEGFAPIVDHEPPDARRALAERIMTGLRLAEGLDGEWVLRQTSGLGIDPGPVTRAVERWASRSLMSESEGRWRLTDAGFLLADGIARDLMRLVR
jgi:oxygen-independent coproporphyrinogen-3 oxidase